MGKPVVLALVAFAATVVVSVTPVRDFLGTENVASFRQWVDKFEFWAPAVFLLVSSLGVGVGFPRLFFACVGGATFGVVQGVALAQLGTLLGCMLTFTYGRWLGRDFVNRRLRGRLKALRTPLEFVGRHGIAANVVVRALPVGNCFVMNLLMSITPISLGDFLIGTLIGTLPETVIYALFGSGVSGGGAAHWLAAGLLLLLLSLGSFLLIRRSRVSHALAEGLTGDPAREITK